MPVPLTAVEAEEHYDGFCNQTLWPLYHGVGQRASYRRRWWDSYLSVNRRFGDRVDRVAAPRASVWVNDYQLQLVPGQLRQRRPDLRIGWYDDIPFPGPADFAAVPNGGAIVDGVLGADLVAFETEHDLNNFAAACAHLGRHTSGRAVRVRDPDGGWRQVQLRSLPISIDFRAVDARGRDDAVVRSSEALRRRLGNPRHLLVGCDRLDYTKGILERLAAYDSLLSDGCLAVPDVAMVLLVSPGREEISAYRETREAIEREVGSINRRFGRPGHPAVHYIGRTADPLEMAALYRAADVMLVTPVRDGMNLVAKEFVACRSDGGGALVLSRHAGAAHELVDAFLCDPGADGSTARQILAALRASPVEKRMRMARCRRVVEAMDVDEWASRFLAELAAATNSASGTARSRPG